MLAIMLIKKLKEEKKMDCWERKMFAAEKIDIFSHSIEKKEFALQQMTMLCARPSRMKSTKL